MYTHLLRTCFLSKFHTFSKVTLHVFYEAVLLRVAAITFFSYVCALFLCRNF